MFWSIWSIIMFIIIIVIIRNEIVSRISKKAIYDIFKRDNWEELDIKLLDNRPYSKMMLDIRKWTFKSFYPELMD